MDKNQLNDEIQRLRAENEQLKQTMVELNAGRQAEEAIDMAALNYRLLVEESHDIIFTANAEGVIGFASRAWEKILGHPVESIPGRSFTDFVHPDHHEMAFDYLRQLSAKSLVKHDIEYKVQHVDGSWRWHRTNGNPLFDQSGKFQGIVGIARDITEIRKAHLDLKESTLLLGNISRNMFDTVVITDHSANITYCSESVHMVGYSTDDLIGHHVMELVHPDDHDRIAGELSGLLSQPGLKRVEVRYRMSDGGYQWYEVVGKPLLDGLSGEGGSFIFSGRNINDRRMVELALEKQKEEYIQLSATIRLMTDTMSDLIWAKDLEKRYLFANRAICEKLLMASDTDEPIGKTDMFFALRERKRYPENPEWHTFGELCRDSDSVTLQEMRPMQFDEFGNVKGKMLYLDVQKAPLYNDRGELIGVVGSARDVTESKVAEKQLTEANETYQGIFNALTEAIYVLDDAGTFIDVNLGAEKMYGYSRQELIGKTPLDVAAPGLNDLDQIFSLMGKTKSDGTVASFEFWACRKNGEVFPKAVIVNKGTYFGKEVLIATARDITAQKQWEAALVQYQKRMQLASDAARFGVWEYDVVNNVLSWDDAMLSIYGIRREEFGDSYQTFFSLVHPGDVEELRKNEMKVLQEGNEFQSEFRIIRPDGQTRYIYAAAAVERNADNRPVRVTGINSDITRRKLDERQLLESEAKLETILGNSYEKIWAVDKDYKVLYINHGFIEDYFKIFGTTLAKGSDIFSGAGNEIREKWKSRYDRVLEGETLSFVDKIGVHDSDIFIDLVMQPLAIGGTVIGVSCCGKDISVKVAADKQAAYEAELRNLLVELSTQFINLPLDRLENAYNASLQRIGKFVDADRAYIFKYDFNSNIATNSFEWCNDGITPYIDQLQNIPLTEFQEFIDIHLKGEVVYINSISEVNNPALNALMERQQVIGLLALPLISNGECMGFIGFDMVRRVHVFTPQEQQLLQVYAQLIVNLRERGDKEEALLDAIEQANTQRAKTEAVIENTTDNIWAIDNGYNLLYVNDNLKQEYIRAFNIELKTGDNKLEKVPDAIRDFWKTNYDRALNREHFSFEQAVPTMGGTTYVQVSMNPIIVGDQVIGVSCFGRNITEQKIAEAQLLEAKNRAEASEEKLRLMIKNSNDSFVLLNANAEILFLSDAASRDTGYSTEELLGPIDRLIHPDDLSRVLEDFARVLNDDNMLGRVRYRHIHKTRGYAWFEAVGQNFLSNPFINAVVINVRNIDYIIESEDELIRAKDRAEESDRLKSAFLANMSHEIRTPMNGILGFAELLKEPELTGDQQNEYIQIIEKSGKRMLGIINDIIDISKIESGLMNLDIKPSNINEQTDYIYTFFKPEAQAKNLTLRINKTLSNTESVIFTDREKLYAILTNLVKNAIKYTHSGTIEMGYRRSGEFIEFYVSDTGIGIPPDRHHAIFERFVQADPVDRQAHQGAGLGLSITRAYVEMLGGSIWVESSPGEGSTFRFTLPVNKGKEFTEGSNSVSQAEAGGLPKPVDANLVILIAEDDDTSRRLLQVLVKPYSARLIEAKSGTEAVEACRIDHEINLVLMDIKLPEMDGYEATRQIRLFNKDLVIIAQTAYGLTGDREKAIQAGCNDYIAKPIDKNKLDTLLSRWFGKP